VTQRTAEIGVRMALGAESRQVSWLILKRGLLQMALGLGIGLVGAFFLSKVMRTLLISVSPSDPTTFVTITVILTAVATAACLLPARRATRVDPLIALRAE
jgi:ABC-type antimicrobial peptide transport system permease subunit